MILASRVFFWNIAVGILMARHGTDAHAAEQNLGHLATVCEMAEDDFARFLVVLTDAEATLARGS